MMGWLNDFTLSFEIVFGLNLVSQHCSDLSEYVKIYLLFKLSLRLKFWIQNL